MLRKPRFRWQEKTERSLSELVSEDGILPSGEILYLTDRLCSILDSMRTMSLSGRECIHPDNVVIDIRGNVRLAERELPPSAMEDYLPPEADRGNLVKPGTRVYALGMLMLYMATGEAKRAEADVSIDDRTILSLIERAAAFNPAERFRNTGELQEAIRQETRVGKKALPILISAVLVCLLIGLLFVFWQRGAARGGEAGEADGYRAGFSQGFEQGFSDAPGIGIHSGAFDAHNGNLSGNHAAEGGAFAVCSEDAVFYLAEDNVYRMDPYTKEARVLAAAPGAYDLQYYSGRLWYCTPKSVICLDPETAKEEVICDSRGGRLYIFEDSFYLYDCTETGYLYRIDPDSKALTQLNGVMKYRCLNIVGEKLYYIDEERGNSIYSSDLDGSNVRLISSSAYESFCIYEDKLFAGTEGGLIRMDLNGGSPEKLTSLSAHSSNASDGGVFYISGSGRTLEWISPDGKTRYTVVPGRAGSFNVAGQWIFYRNEDDGGRLWRVRISGADNARATGQTDPP